MTRKLFFLSTAIVLVPLCARADDAGQIVTSVADTYRNLKSYRFEGETVRHMGARESADELKFDIAFEGPDKFRISYKYPTAGDWIRVSDGKTLTRYRSISKQVNAAAASPGDVRLIDSTPIARYSHLDDVAAKAKLVGSEQLSVNGRPVDCYVIEVPGEKPPFEGIKSLPTKLWIAKDSHIVYREESGTESSSGRETRTTTYTYIQTSGDIPDTLFAFSK